MVQARAPTINGGVAQREALEAAGVDVFELELDLFEPRQQLAPRPGRYPLLPELSPRAEVALMCRVLFQEGYDDHIAGQFLQRVDSEMPNREEAAVEESGFVWVG